MPTTRGWAALGAGAALAILWIGFGENLLLAVAVFLLVAVGLGMLYVRLTAPRVAIGRRLTPFQVHDGDRVVVEVSLSSGRRIYQVDVTDHVHGLGSAHFVADRVESRQPMVARYEILCRPRGIYQVGPSDVRVRDPLGLTESGGTAGSADRLVVYPAVEDLDGLPLGRGQDPSVNTSRANFANQGGEDFFTLREYQQGDDLRKVHWRSSAKRDELMIRQLEMPWQSRALVLFDPRRAKHPGAESYEQAVRGAASVLRHLFTHGYTPTLWAGRGSGTIVGSSDAYTIAMEELAVIQPNDQIDLQATVAKLRRGGMAGGVMVLITGPPDDADLGAFRLLSRDFYRTVVMSVADRANEGILQFARAGAATAVTPASGSWSTVWKETMERTWSTATAG
jgi:uncharacterized protein (DUF58 family)